MVLRGQRVWRGQQAHGFGKIGVPVCLDSSPLGLVTLSPQYQLSQWRPYIRTVYEEGIDTDFLRNLGYWTLSGILANFRICVTHVVVAHFSAKGYYFLCSTYADHHCTCMCMLRSAKRTNLAVGELVLWQHPYFTSPFLEVITPLGQFSATAPNQGAKSIQGFQSLCHLISLNCKRKWHSRFFKYF